ncbi:MAG: PAS domain S-box protein [Candidatus Methanoperedens sp.]|nr:PAS domain S-box protein [Candidatus Methanoperedens sp.]
MKKELHILILEDNSADAELMEHELHDAGIVFSAKRVETKDSFIKELENFTPDIIITDYKLPSFNGSSALAIAKAECQDVPVIFVTGALGEEMAVEILKKGATDYILKHRLSHLAPAVLRALREVEERVERKRADEALRESERKYHALAELSPVGIFRTDAEGDCTYINERWQKITGLTLEEALGKGWVQSLHPDDRNRISEEWYQAVREHRPFKSEYRFLNRDGTTTWVLGQAIIERTNSERVANYIGTITDITERKHAEEQLKESLREKEILLREIHHRVKNNMQVISSLLMLQEELSEDEKVIEMLKDSQNRIISMALIHEKLYRSENFSRIDLKEYIDDLVSGLFQSYGISEDKVALNINAENVLLGIDSAIPCGLIINELVSNSLKHAFPEDESGEINILIHSTDEDMIELSIGDNGIGIPEDLDFRRTESLGLRIVNVLVENQLHGEITLNRDRGTKFKIKFKGMK